MSDFQNEVIVETKKVTLSQKFKRIFITGILACLPLIVTVYLIMFLFRLLTSDILPVISNIMAKFHIIIPPQYMGLIALALVIIIIFLIGLIARAYIGGKVFDILDNIVSKIPIARTIYNGTKQVIDSFSATSGSTFSKVVIIEYPRKDIWVLAFVVKDTQEFMNDSIGKVCYNVFVPTAPNPTSGFVLIIPKCDAQDIEISVEDGIKFVLSAGVVTLKGNKLKDVH